MPDVEVESKYPLAESLDVWRERLTRLGARPGESVLQQDEYFAHPARDFVATGEAFRIRTVGERNAVTYKGPLLDSHTKSRRELEVDFATGDRAARELREIVLALGFRPAGCVRKHRTPLQLDWRDRTLTLALDAVEGLGNFLEIEVVTPDSEWNAARDDLLAFAGELGLSASERRSYLELLLLSLERPSPLAFR